MTSRLAALLALLLLAGCDQTPTLSARTFYQYTERPSAADHAEMLDIIAAAHPDAAAVSSWISALSAEEWPAFVGWLGAALERGHDVRALGLLEAASTRGSKDETLELFRCLQSGNLVPASVTVLRGMGSDPTRRSDISLAAVRTLGFFAPQFVEASGTARDALIAIADNHRVACPVRLQAVRYLHMQAVYRTAFPAEGEGSLVALESRVRAQCQAEPAVAEWLRLVDEAKSDPVK